MRMSPRLRRWLRLLDRFAAYLLLLLRPAPSRAPGLLGEADAISDEVLFARLWSIVRREQLAVLPRSWIMWVNNPADPRHGQDAAGKYDASRGIIWLHPEYCRSPWVLAHELGHHMLREQLHGEAEADAEGRRLVLGLLTEQEAEALRWKLDIHLPALESSIRRDTKKEENAMKIKAVAKPRPEPSSDPEHWAPPFRRALAAGWRLIQARLAKGEEPDAQPFVEGMVWIIFDRSDGMKLSWLPIERCQRVSAESGWKFEALDQPVQPHHVRVLVLSHGSGAACQVPLPAGSA